ncbi:stalk domain-containing protein [Ammoniphilus sp. 3BR4]|uniref:stalk domain-containing protein n=1 Tax=Ammoniphilus sp. 3BR4 TaxID=3158265 RepID=UPI0034673CCA
MNKKARTALIIATLATGSLWMGNTVMASSAASAAPLERSEQAVQRDDSSDYIKFSGVISEIKQNDQSLTLIVENEENSLQMIFPISDEVLLLNSSTTEKLEKHSMEKGLQVDVYYDKTKPMPLIYPATISPEVIIAKDKDMGLVKVSKFDEQFQSLDHELKLNISEDTVLLNKQGEQINKEDLHGKELIVFYTFTKKSIPAQTTPKKIIALNNEYELPMKVEQLINEDHYMKEGTKMIPIRKVAEYLGYSVEWNQESLSIFLRKQNQSFTIAIGENAYGYNRSIRYFDVAPEMINGRSYIPVEFVKMLSIN